MVFLFEQFPYPKGSLDDILPKKGDGIQNLPKGFIKETDKSGERILDGVGYLYNANTKKSIFILPKVFLDKDSAFGQPILSQGKPSELKEVPPDFLENLSMWVCASIGQYRRSNPNNTDIDVPDSFRSNNAKTNLSLIELRKIMMQFYAENRDLFVFVAKNKYSGNHRIDWHKTVANTQPFIQGDIPVYTNLVNKRKVFDLDDRLLVLYFSAMNYIEETCPDFKMPKSEFYKPMRTNEFRHLLGHRGLMELRRIKHKYFADRFLKLFKIMRAFFEWGGNFKARNFKSEYLLTSKYNNVFEATIDFLLSDDLPQQMKYLKSQKDNKIVDHLYMDRQLIFADDAQKIWFIGDSKYYKDGNKIEGNSIYKQYTYAKNIIQYNINDLLGEKKDSLRYRDNLTEGYSVTPNFFIRGFIPRFASDSSKREKQFREPYLRTKLTEAQLIAEDARNNKYQLVDEEGKILTNYKKSKSLWDLRNRHFINRLFDRDTLLLQVYNVNFLYVLKAYTSKRSSLREEFKKKARKMFRENFLELLDKKYVFYAIWPKKNLKKKDGKKSIEEAFVNAHFRTLVGKIFKPEGLRCLILALENISDETEVYAEKEELRKMKVMWAEIKGDCEWFHVSPKEIFPGVSLLKPAEFDKKDWYFDKEKFGIFVKRGAFKKANIGVQHQLPSKIGNHKLNGSILGDIDLVRMAKNKSRLDKYYFLPCK